MIKVAKNVVPNKIGAFLFDCLCEVGNVPFTAGSVVGISMRTTTKSIGHCLPSRNRRRTVGNRSLQHVPNLLLVGSTTVSSSVGSDHGECTSNVSLVESGVEVDQSFGVFHCGEAKGTDFLDLSCEEFALVVASCSGGLEVDVSAHRGERPSDGSLVEDAVIFHGDGCDLLEDRLGVDDGDEVVEAGRALNESGEEALADTTCFLVAAVAESGVEGGDGAGLQLQRGDEIGDGCFSGGSTASFEAVSKDTKGVAKASGFFEHFSEVAVLGRIGLAEVFGEEFGDDERTLLRRSVGGEVSLELKETGTTATMANQLTISAGDFWCGVCEGEGHFIF